MMIINPQRRLKKNLFLNMREPLMISHIVYVEGTMKEACPVLLEFELFNPEVLDKSKKGWKELLTMLFNVYGTTIGDY